MKRRIIRIDRDKCNGCGDCVNACHEGAIQLVNGKAELVSDIYCDGLGDCIGDCPVNAISFEEREAEEYNQVAVQQRLQKIAVEKRPDKTLVTTHTGCPGMRKMSWDEPNAKQNQAKSGSSSTSFPSALRQWPIQLKLVPIAAPYWNNAQILLSADCVAHACGGFHAEVLNGRKLIIACPKLDHGIDEYITKLAAILRENNVASLTVAYMEVPCCHGLLRIAQDALNICGKDISFNQIKVGIDGTVQK